MSSAATIPNHTVAEVHRTQQARLDEWRSGAVTSAQAESQVRPRVTPFDSRERLDGRGAE